MKNTLRSPLMFSRQISASCRVRSGPSVSVIESHSSIEPLPFDQSVHVSNSRIRSSWSVPTIEKNTGLGRQQPRNGKLSTDEPWLSVSNDPLVGLNGDEILHEMLIANNVNQIFGFPQHPKWLNCHEPFEAIYSSAQLRPIIPQNEQGAGHMAQGYARVTGEPGVVLVTSGAGVTNLVTPMQDALCDGTPMVILCGQAHTTFSDADEFQQSDVLSVTKPCTKWNISVSSVSELPQRINEAFEVATSGRPGPVLIKIPRHIFESVLVRRRTDSTKNSISRRLNAAAFNISSASNYSRGKNLGRVANLVDIAKKPVLYVGQGILARPEGAAVLKEFADKASIPVTTSLQGVGAFDELDPKALHMLGLHGAGYANLAIQEADLILAVGARFDDRITGSIPKFAPQALKAAAEQRGGIVHFDIAQKNINKVVQATEAVVGDCTENLKLLVPLITRVEDRPEWFAQIDNWKARFPFSAYKRVSTPGVIKAQAVIEKLSDMTHDIKNKTIITTGVGQHQMFAAQHFRWRYPRTMITSGGLGTMGYGLPAAIGAKVAKPECLVIDIDGDASFNMTMAEMRTAARYNIGVKVLLCNNHEMGMVVDLQRLYYDERIHKVRQRNPDFVLATEALGVAARKCTAPSDLASKLEWLIEHEGPALLEVVVQGNSPVWPIVPAGKGLHEFVTYPEIADT